MAHWAEIDKNYIVQRVLVGSNNEPDEGYATIAAIFGGTWIQTSYNAATNGFRKHYAGIGYTYDPGLDAFYPPQPYPSWTLDEDCNWQPPTPHPINGNFYIWNEETLEWIQE